MQSTKEKRERIDSLIDHLWRNGYLTLSRKYGKYLPSPQPVGNYEIDAVAKYKKKIALGITLTEEDLNDPGLVTKLHFITNFHTKNSSNKVTLFLGVPESHILKAEMILSSIDDNTREKIKIVSIPDKR
ncbi:MAG TPA: hypothetical protein PLZ15_12965 [Melioribacteraceae bacterium]|nr:hypothetical protein [Melioribacteraceae bacterium]